MLSIVFIFILLVYVIFIGLLSRGFDNVNNFKLQDLKPKTRFSVVIPFRNEAKHLPQLLASISELNYPNSHFEVIFVDDESDDNFENVVNTFLKNQQHTQNNNMSFIKNKRRSNSPKKDAIATAIFKAKYDWIITTDADCILPTYWLDGYDEFIQTHAPKAIAGPVEFTGSLSFFSRFQQLDTLSLQGATIGAFGINQPFMCNGANFAYHKNSFLEVDGFTGNNHIASGDDVFLLQKLKTNYPKHIHFLKSTHAIVKTKVADSVSEYIEQRLRWASKTKHYASVFSKLLGVFVFLANLLIVSLIPLAILGVVSLKAAALLFLLKFSIDVLLLFKTARFFKTEYLLLSYIFSSFIYPILTVYIVCRLPFSKINWKGRPYKT